jgi:hypothetical protein
MDSLRCNQAQTITVSQQLDGLLWPNQFALESEPNGFDVVLRKARTQRSAAQFR